MKKKEDNGKKCIYAELIVDFLVEKNLSHVFDLTGGMIAFLEDAISRKNGIECVPMHHEQAAGFAAEGYARLGQNFGVAIATSGPGATNLITAVGSCYFDSVPVLFITGQVHIDNLKKNAAVRQEGFQETDIVSVVKTLTKYAVLIKKPEDVIYELEKAYYLMKQGRFGPVLVDIPINLQRTLVDEKSVKHFFGSREHSQLVKKSERFIKKIDEKKISKLRMLLTKAKAPLVVVGNGVRLSQTSKELADFVEKNNIPVVSSLLGLDAYTDQKLFVGYIGSNGNRGANIIFANADLIIALGTRLDIRQTGDAQFFNKKAIIVHVDIDKSSLNYAIKSELSFETNLTTFFKGVENFETEAKQKWQFFIKEVQKSFARTCVETKLINPNLFFHTLSQVTPALTTVVIDVGQNQQWCAQSWVVKHSQRMLYSGGMGAMGFALPSAIGAWCADKKSNLVVISGDGGIQINIQELETVSRHQIPMKLFIINNKSLGMVREFQDLYLNKNHQSTVNGYGNPDFKKLADAYGFEYMCISVIDSDVLADIMKKKKPIFIEVLIDITAPLQPKVVYGHALDDQAPYLQEAQKVFLEKLKGDLNVL